MTRRVVIIGCGGFGREVFGIIQAQRAHGADWQLEGFIDDAASDSNRECVAALGSRVLGPVDHMAQLGQVNAVIAVGAPVSRESISRRVASLQITWPVLIHPETSVGVNVSFDEGVVVAAGARLSTNISISRHVQIDQNATVGHDVTIREFARLNPQCCISGSVTIGAGSLVGASATVLAGIKIGQHAIVGAAACVTKDVAPNTTVKGVPAK